MSHTTDVVVQHIGSWLGLAPTNIASIVEKAPRKTYNVGLNDCEFFKEEVKQPKSFFFLPILYCEDAHIIIILLPLLCCFTCCKKISTKYDI